MILLMLFELFPINLLVNDNIAQAAAETSIPLSFSSDGTLAGYQTIYSKHNTLTTDTIHISASTGKLIDQVKLFKDGVQKGTIPEASNKVSWNGTANLTGTPVNVISANNESAQGYYAWYRYKVNDPTHGNGWYENGGSCPVPSFSTETELVNGTAMPKYPGCTDDQLSLSASRDTPYKDGTTDLPSTIVDVSSMTFDVTINDNDKISGPDGEGIASGKTDYTTVVNSNRTVAHDSDNYTVWYKQVFDHEGEFKNLGLPGAKLMVYYAAFYVNIRAKTYTYPDHIEITYKDAPVDSKPDLVVDSITPPAACIKVGESKSYTYKINNQGVSTNQSFKVKISVDSTEVVTHSYPSGIATNQPATGTFNYTFSSAGTKSFTVFVDSNNDINEEDENNNTKIIDVTAKSTCDSTPPVDPTVTITGDFSMSKTTVIWRSGNLLIPENIQITGNCSYASHQFVYTQTAGNRYYAPRPLTSKDDVHLFEFDTGMKVYGGNIGLGVVSVSMTINTTCGQTKIVGPKTFTIITDPNKERPTIKIDWFRSGSNEPTRSVTQDEFVDIKVTEESKNTETRLWDFSKTAWTSSLPAANNWTAPYNKKNYMGFKATVEGYHEVCVTAYDIDEMASTPSCTTLYVEGKKPIPVIKGATSVKEGRKLSPPLDALSSFTKVPGRSINHSLDEWTNWFGPDTRYMTPGEELVELHVYDNTGLKSETPARHSITVYPDAPPIIDFEYMATITRVQKWFKNLAYSPDGDPIAKYTVSYGYDRYNSGMCNPLETNISNDNEYFPFQPNRVGNYCFRVEAVEAEVDGAGGKSAFKDYRVQVINDNPETEFTVTGIATEPMPVNVTAYPANALANWTNTSLDKPSIFNSWSVTSDGRLISARRLTNQFKFSLPLGSGNFALNKKKIKIDGYGQNHSLGIVSIGNNEFINTTPGLGPGSANYYLVGPTHNPIKIPTSFLNSSLVVRQDIGELLIVRSESWVSNPFYFQSESWERYKLSDLRNLVTAKNASGVYTKWSSSNYNNSTNVGTSGSPPTFSNGENTLVGYARLKFNSDYKEINTATRTIKSFKPDHLVTPYKTETYDTVPALGGNLNLFNSSTISQSMLYIMSSSILDKATDAKGNYYSYAGGALIRWDGNTGMPSYAKTAISGTDCTAFLGISADAKYAMFSCGTNYYWDEDYGRYLPRSSGTFYENIASGAVTQTKPYDYMDFLKEQEGTFQNGYAVKATTVAGTPYYDNDTDNACNCWVTPTYQVTNLYDAGANQIINTTTPVMPDQKKILFLNNNQYLDFTDPVPVEQNTIYLNEYVPSEDQTPYSNEFITYGQLLNPSSQRVVGGTIAWNLLMHDVNYSNYHAGVSFRIQDTKNMYRVESHYKYIQLVKIVNGRKTVLGKVNRTALSETWMNYKVKLTTNHIKVYENGGLVLDLYDNTFSEGTMGPYSVADNAEFKGITYLWTDADLVTPTPGVAIVDTDVTYETTYTDPEHDPAFIASTQWQYAHVDTTKFLDAGDGKSGLSVHHGQVVTSPILNFDKVGVYKVDYRVPDDPHPDHLLAWGDPTFAEHSKYSDWYSQYLIVHRRPIAKFTLGLDGYNFVTWTDYSYDPDRCYNVSSCQSGYETAQGILHGITKKKFYYITPSGTRADAKLVKPLETGVYTVAMAVADEYNAWSDWYEETIMVTIPVAPNNPPTVQLTFPNGSYAAPSPVSLLPTIHWNQADPDPGTIYSTFDLSTKDEWGNCVECVTNRVMDTPLGSWAWTMDVPLTMGQKYQSQVRVSDGEAWSPWSNIGWMATNSPPVAYMSYPYGSQTAPTIVNTVRPTLTWSQSDPDPGAVFYYFQIQVTNEANNMMIADSGKVWQGTAAAAGSYLVPTDIPAGQKLRVRVKVWDQYGSESNWSPQTWMMINRGPKADFVWTPQPAFEGDEVILLNRSTDPDGDPLTFSWHISGSEYDSTQISGDAIIPATATDFHPGDYMVTLTATDPYGAADTVTKTVRIGDLLLEAFVKHTVVWEEKRKSYNLHSTGDAERPRPSDMFWSGEAFVLDADTNEAAARVSVRMSYMELRTELSSTNHTLWTGKLQRDDFENLPDAMYTFQFTAVWPNGHTETVNRTITVKNAWTDFASSVRKE
ncbi:CARDB domain-containing protein [Paenibacillus sp. M.A.Huq-84]